MPRKVTNAVHRHFERNVSGDNYSSCKLCGKKLKGYHATNLMNHLHLKHETQYKEVVEINKVSTKIKEKNTVKDEKEKKRKKLLDCCVRLIAVHGRPLQFLEDKAFREIKALISSDFEDEANKKKIRELITDKAYEIKDKISTELDRMMISVKMDSATCMDRQFIGINIQYIKDSKIVVRNVGLIEIFVRQTAENLKSKMLDVLGDFRIQLCNIYSVTTDNGANYLKVTTLLNQENLNENQNEVEVNDSADETNEYEGNHDFDSGIDNLNVSDINETIEGVTEENQFQIPAFKCAAHILQLCIKDAIKKDPGTESVIESCRSVVRILRRPLMKLKIKPQKLRKPIIDCTTRWASTYNMLNRLKELKPICDDSDEVAETVSENFWIELDDIIKSLHPSAEATVRLQAEQLTLGDFYSIWNICKNKTETLNLPLARDIVTIMTNRESSFVTNEAFLAAIYIDPRWKVVLSDQEKEIAKRWLKNVYQQMVLINQERAEINLEGPVGSSAPLTTQSLNVPNIPPADSYHADLQSLESILNETQRVRARSSGSVTLNFDYYLAEYDIAPRLAITENVLDYWSHKLPHKLAEVALVVLAAPATQVTVERLFSVLKFILTPSRNRLLDQTIKSMILIKCNEDLFDDV